MRQAQEELAVRHAWQRQLDSPRNSARIPQHGWAAARSLSSLIQAEREAFLRHMFSSAAEFLVTKDAEIHSSEKVMGCSIVCSNSSIISIGSNTLLLRKENSTLTLWIFSDQGSRSKTCFGCLSSSNTLTSTSAVGSNSTHQHGSKLWRRSTLSVERYSRPFPSSCQHTRAGHHRPTPVHGATTHDTPTISNLRPVHLAACHPPKLHLRLHNLLLLSTCPCRSHPPAH